MHHAIPCRGARAISHLVSACLALFFFCSAALAQAPTTLDDGADEEEEN